MIHSIPLGYHSYSLYQYKINVYCRNKTISFEVLTNLERICRTSSLHERIRTRPGGSNSHQLSYKFFVIFTSTLFSPDHSANVSYFYNNRQPVNMLQISAHPCCDSRLPYNRVYIVPNIHCIPLCIYHHIYADQFRKVTTSRYSIRLEPSSRPNDPENFVLSTLSGISIHIFLDSTSQYAPPNRVKNSTQTSLDVHPDEHRPSKTLRKTNDIFRVPERSHGENEFTGNAFKTMTHQQQNRGRVSITQHFIHPWAENSPYLRISNRDNRGSVRRPAPSNFHTQRCRVKPFKFFGQSHGSRIATGRRER